MIKVDGAYVTVEGSNLALAVELAMGLKSLMDEDVFDEECILAVLEIAKKDKPEYEDVKRLVDAIVVFRRKQKDNIVFPDAIKDGLVEMLMDEVFGEE